MTYFKWFSELRKTDIAEAGGKGANLGELTAAEVPVPGGFVVLASAYFTFLDYNDLRPKIKEYLEGINVEDPAALELASSKVQDAISKANFPPEMSTEIIAAYHELASRENKPNLPVAVRSSATAEDLPDASFAGQQESYLNVIGDANVMLKIRQCYESLFGARAIYYRVQQKYDHFKVGIAVPVQTLVYSEVSGVMLTVDPLSKDKDLLVIEAAFGLGDYVVQGVVTPDHFEIKKSTLDMVKKNIARQDIKEVRTASGVDQEAIPPEEAVVQKLPDDKVIELAKIGIAIQNHYLAPQDIEWAYAGDKLYITQARPITTLNDTQSAQGPTVSTGNLTL